MHHQKDGFRAERDARLGDSDNPLDAVAHGYELFQLPDAHQNRRGFNGDVFPLLPSQEEEGHGQQSEAEDDSRNQKFRFHIRKPAGTGGSGLTFTVQ